MTDRAKKRPWRRRLAIAVALLLLIPLSALPIGYLWLRGSLPQAEGEISLSGSKAPITLLRDADGLLTIQAESDQDAAFGLGFAHAQDRLWQMDFTRRTGAGRLAEVAGEAVVPTDRFMRVMGFESLAQATFERLSPEARGLFEAYSRGVNAYLEQRSGPLPLAFLVLGYEPEPWEPVHSLLWARLMALQLSGNWRDELRRIKAERRLAPEDLPLLWADDGPDAPVTLENAGLAIPEPARRALLDLLPPRLWPQDASNAWVIAGQRSETGKPILANDPHLPLTAPGFWYLVRIETPQGVLAGVTAPSVPLLVAGHNGKLAWGFTTTHADTQDLFVEQIDPEDATLVRAAEGTRPIESRQEEIAVRDQEPEIFTVRSIGDRPVISDVLGREGGLMPEDTLLSLAWPALLDDDMTPEALFRLNRAASVSEAKVALADFHAPVQNIFLADRDGAIGFVTAGRLPFLLDAAPGL